MEVANTSFNLGDAGSSNVDTSSSISNGINGSQQTSYQTSINTGSYQSNGTYTGAETETYDLSGSTTEDNRNVIQRVGDWISDAANSVYETGANIVSDAYSWIVGGLKGIGSTLEETAANLASDVGTFAAKVGSAFLDGYTALMSTEAVIATSIVSGVAKLGEHFVDVALWCGGKISEGRAYVAGTIVGLFDKDLGNAIKNAGHQANQQMKEWIEFDAVGEANKWFYENTGLGRWINDNSLMKYDSEAAMKIRGITEKAAEVAAATALTIATGGAATFAIGALYGIGKQAESTYQQHGTDTTLLQEAGILGSGALTGLSWLVKGKLGAGFLEIGKTAAEVGVKEVISQISKDVLTKDFWMKALKEGLTGANGVGNYAASAMMTGEDIIPYLNGEKPWDAKAVGHIALCYLKNLGYNVAEDALRGYISGFNSEKVIESITESASKIDGEMSETDLEHVVAGVPVSHTDDIAETGSKINDDLSEADLERVVAGVPASHTDDIAETGSKINDDLSEADLEHVVAGVPVNHADDIAETSSRVTDNISDKLETPMGPEGATTATQEYLSARAAGNRIRGMSRSTQEIMEFSDDVEKVEGYPTKFIVEVDGHKVYFDGYAAANGEGAGAVKHFITSAKSTMEVREDASTLHTIIDKYIADSNGELDSETLNLLQRLKEKYPSGSLTPLTADAIKKIVIDELGISADDYDASKYIEIIKRISDGADGYVLRKAGKSAEELLKQAGIYDKVLSDELGDTYKTFKGKTYGEILELIKSRSGDYITNEEFEILNEISSEASNKIYIKAVSKFLSGDIVEDKLGYSDFTGVMVHMQASEDPDLPFYANIITRPNVAGRDLNGDLSVIHLTKNDRGSSDIKKVIASTVEVGKSKQRNSADNRGREFTSQIMKLLVGDDAAVQELVEKTGASPTTESCRSIIISKINDFFGLDFFNAHSGDPNDFESLRHYIADSNLREKASEAAFEAIIGDIIRKITGGS